MLFIRLVYGIIILQTLFFKFSNHPDSVYIFNKIGFGELGCMCVGILELIALILLFIPKTIIYGAILIFGLMGGAIFFHLTSLGIEVNNDNGTLFYMAVISFILNLIVLFKKKNELITLFRNQNHSVTN